MSNTKHHHDTLNLSQTERTASLIGGGTLIAYGLQQRSWKGLGMAAVGGLLAYRGATGHCHVYQAIGVDKGSGWRGHNVSVPYESGTRVDGQVVVNIPRSEAYRFWRNLENVPKFMHGVQSVKEIDNKTSHWVANAPAGASVEWTAEIINEIENQLLGWRSVDGDIGIAGSVQFKDVSGGRTEIKLENQYNAPGGKLAAWIAKVIGGDPAAQLDRDLQRFKQLMETGEVVAKDTRVPKKGWVRDEVGQASEDSFPASDPPSWTPEAMAH
jgi:uncharacterized membrane protein